MTRRWLVAAAVVVLVAGAGCGGLTGTHSNPAETPAETTAASASGPPPGIENGTVVDASALVAAHTRALTSGSFTVRATVTRRNEVRNVTVTTEKVYRVASTDPVRGVRRVEQSVRGDPPSGFEATSMVAWRNGSTSLVRRTTGEAVRYRRVTLPEAPIRLGRAAYRRRVGDLAEATSVTVERVTRDGERLYRVEATVGPSRFVDSGNLTLLVAPDGLVRRIEATRVVEVGSGERTFTYDVEVSAVGATDVERPDWYSEAVNATE